MLLWMQLEVLNTMEVKMLHDSLKDYCSPAFYLTVPVDAFENNVIYINEKNALSGIDLYTTLAHEGFPGHLYQTVFFHQINTPKHTSDIYAFFGIHFITVDTQKATLCM